MFGRRRRRPAPDQIGLAPIPLGGYNVAPSPEVAMWRPMGVVSSDEQIGRYGTLIPTQQAGYWPDVQLRCGVEGIERHFMVLTAWGADVPYFQQTAYPVDPKRNLLDGRRPGQALGVAGVAALLGPARKARTEQQQALAADILGW
jgi:hypothetical protein